MRKIRILSIIVFLAAIAVFGVYHFKKLRMDDHVAPRIQMSAESITVSVLDGEAVLLEGITAEDSRDGDVSQSLIVESMTQFIEPGRRNITVAAVDKAGNVAKASREIIYSDYESPTYSVSKAFRFPVGTTSFLENVKVQDVLDGDLSNKIKISTEYTVSTSVVGEYATKLIVINSAGDIAELPITIQLYDPTIENLAPKFTLSDYMVYKAIGETFDPWDYVNEIRVGQTDYRRSGNGVLYSDEGEALTRGEIIMDASRVSVSQAGTYEIIYSMTDASGRLGVSRLIVCYR